MVYPCGGASRGIKVDAPMAEGPLEGFMTTDWFGGMGMGTGAARAEGGALLL